MMCLVTKALVPPESFSLQRGLFITCSLPHLHYSTSYLDVAACALIWLLFRHRAGPIELGVPSQDPKPVAACLCACSCVHVCVCVGVCVRAHARRGPGRGLVRIIPNYSGRSNKLSTRIYAKTTSRVHWAYRRALITPRLRTIFCLWRTPGPGSRRGRTTLPFCRASSTG